MRLFLISLGAGALFFALFFALMFGAELFARFMAAADPSSAPQFQPALDNLASSRTDVGELDVESWIFGYAFIVLLLYLTLFSVRHYLRHH